MAPSLPAQLAPPAPFPLVVAQWASEHVVAPGVRRLSYRLQTSNGPLAIEAVVVDPSEPTLRLAAVVAHDRLVSSGETVSSMALRTQAVAGINADYFDIGQTNQPLNIVVRDGALLRTPSQRIVLDVRRDRSVRFETFAFHGDVSYGGAHVPLTAVNEWPPHGGAALLTPEFGMLRAAPEVTIATLAPLANDASGAATYRVQARGDAAPARPSSLALAFGPAAVALASPPAPGDAVTVSQTLVPALGDVVTAVGGGPQLVARGRAVDDPDAPAPEERDVRFPVAGAATLPSGALALVTVDGRDRTRSVGLTRPEFAALMLALGATDAIAFDSGGSAELVAREPGDRDAEVSNVPSDGEERRVADGLFVYSDAPLGPPATLAIRPAEIVALPNVDVRVSAFVLDAAGHTLGAAHLHGGDVVRGVARSSVALVRAGSLTARVPIRIVAAPARLEIRPLARAVRAGATVTLRAVASDAAGVPVETGVRVAWSADRGSFMVPGVFRAPAHDARIVARVGPVKAEYQLFVGETRIALDVLDAVRAPGWRFATAPSGGPGSIDRVAGGLAIHFDFRGGGRAAYANGSFVLPGRPLRFAIDVAGDGSGVGLRAAFVNALGERRALTLAKTVDWSGTRTCEIELPQDVYAPIRLVSFYAVPLAASASRSAGTLVLSHSSVVVAGTP